ncbi:MAG: AzlC family ABC transporter permease [Acidimicrobiia bacterium]|nr:AzlC family ABC transporter permease [Acidimicrobiia bacterium]
MNGNTSYRRGVRDVMPILLGVIPFGLIAGISSIDAGLDVSQAIGLSVVVFAGASQLAAIALIGENAALAVIILTPLVINARFLMYSASLASHFSGLPVSRRIVASYLLTDQSYAFSIIRYRDETWDLRSRLSYYLGIATTLWIVWQLSTAAGAILGAGVPDPWSLDFAVPLVFLALLVPAIRDRADGIAAAVAGALVIIAAGLPYNLALPLAAVAGIAAGVGLERKARA